MIIHHYYPQYHRSSQHRWPPPPASLAQVTPNPSVASTSDPLRIMCTPANNYGLRLSFYWRQLQTICQEQMKHPPPPGCLNKWNTPWVFHLCWRFFFQESKNITDKISRISASRPRIVSILFFHIIQTQIELTLLSEASKHQNWERVEYKSDRSKLENSCAPGDSKTVLFLSSTLTL